MTVGTATDHPTMPNMPSPNQTSLGLSFLAFSFRFMRAGVTIGRARVVCWTTMFVLLVLHLGFWIVFLIGNEHAWAFSGFWLALIRDLGQRGAVAWVLTYLSWTLLAGLAWRLASRQFAAVEPPRP